MYRTRYSQERGRIILNYLIHRTSQMERKCVNTQDMRFSKKLTGLMTDHNLSLRDVAARVGVSATTVARWLRDEGEGPRLDQAWRLARSADVPLEFLADDAQAEPATGLSDREGVLLGLARTLGVETAIERILLVPGGAGGIKANPSPPGETGPTRDRKNDGGGETNSNRRADNGGRS